MLRAFAIVAPVLALTVQPTVDGDVLEPSVLNEVEHALAVAPAKSAPATGAIPAAWTNGATRTAVAVALVSAQRADGTWRNGTNDVTAAVLPILENLAR